MSSSVAGRSLYRVAVITWSLLSFITYNSTTAPALYRSPSVAGAVAVPDDG